MKKLFAAIAFAVAFLCSTGTQATTGCYIWSKTAATNATADASINWAEGQAPSSVNDSARALMARLAECRDDLSGQLLTGGTSTAFTLTTNQAFDTLAHMDGARVCFRVHAANGTPAQLNVDGLGLNPLRTGPSVELVAAMTNINAPYCATYKNSTGEWYLNNYYSPAGIQPNTITTAMLQNSAVTYAKVQNVTDQKFLGNFSGGAAAPSEYGIGAGLVMSGSNLTAPSAPVAGTFKNLSIKVASNTTVTVAADFVAMTDATNYKTLACSGTVNLGTTGANALDSGVIAINTWYAIWCIAKSDGTVATLASTSFTSPSMPSGYTYKARIGAVRTISGSATLYGTWQFGRRAQYVVGLAQTTTAVNLIGNSSGSTTLPTWTAVSINNYAPTTASAVFVSAWCTGAGRVIVAPNSSYGAYTSTTNPPPIMATSNVAVLSQLLLESTNIYYASDGGVNSGLFINGWEDGL